MTKVVIGTKGDDVDFVVITDSEGRWAELSGPGLDAHVWSEADGDTLTLTIMPDIIEWSRQKAEPRTNG